MAEEGWVCGCGNWNFLDEDMCSGCGNPRGVAGFSGYADMSDYSADDGWGCADWAIRIGCLPFLAFIFAPVFGVGVLASGGILIIIAGTTALAALLVWATYIALRGVTRSRR